MQVISQDRMRVCIYEGAAITREYSGTFSLTVFGKGGRDVVVGRFSNIEKSRAVMCEMIAAFNGRKDAYGVPAE